MADVDISYKGSIIASMSASGTKILETEGKYCEDDITINYTKAGITVTETLDPNGGTIVSISGDPVTSLQAKTVIPTSQSLTISADSGYDAISEVLVQGDSNLVSSNIASGVSIFGVVGTFAGSGGGLKDFIEQHGTITSFSDSAISSIGYGAFAYCVSLTAVSIPACTTIGSYAFQACYNLLSLYLTGSSVAKLNYSNAFSSTPIAGYTTSTGGVYGSIFVPSSLYSTYIASTNWTYFSSRFVSI